jgi:Putative beta-lactamase-inhibitor-like, PepSY-like
MKTILLILVTVLSINYSYSQKINESQVPAPVKAKFQLLHPDIKNVSWTKHERGGYEAEFKQNDTEFGVSMDSTGNLKETEMEMKVSELSKEIHEYVAMNYPDHIITEAAQITYADRKPMYEVEITRGKESADLLFDSCYKFIKKGHY